VFARLATRAEQAPQPVVRGLDGWLFVGSELRHLGLGRFWGPRAVEVSRAAKPEWADPLPAILDFKAQLDGAGIEFLLVPVPAKAAVYPDRVPGLAGADPSLRWDAEDAAFYEVLRGQGVEVIDLVPEFRRARQAGDRPVYCRQDTHWAGPAIERTASLLAARLRRRSWFASVPSRRFESERRTVEINGDLLRMLDDTSTPPGARAPSCCSATATAWCFTQAATCTRGARASPIISPRSWGFRSISSPCAARERRPPASRCCEDGTTSRERRSSSGA
jgi:alginate O-acetyltransferase complex protein AlgJ